ncbi:MAG: zinc ribbon domain-containing protein [Chloroflexi bacterium]|nr:zinc ribbon domain-containing protein [Chloroflexota bacterium]
MDVLDINRFLNTGLQLFAMVFGVFFVAFVLSLVVWTARDIHNRTRDIFAQLLAILLVLIFNLPGLLLYFILRPPETLSEVYERALEEEALLQELENRQVCPTCQQRVEDTWQFCPTCHTRLKKLCAECNRILDLRWELCPYCGYEMKLNWRVDTKSLHDNEPQQKVTSEAGSS